MVISGGRSGAAWRGSEIARVGDWCIELDGVGLDPVVEHAIETAARIERGELALRDVDPHGGVGPGGGPGRLGELDRIGAAVRRQLLDGCGFALVRGLPVDEIDAAATSVLFWLLGLRIGVPLHQNAAGDLIVPVRDEGKDFAEDGVRAYETTAPLEYHTDSADVVGLLCRRPAARGGTSTIVSSVTVYEEVARRRPDLARLLEEPWPELNPVDGGVTWRPIAARAADGRLASRYGRKYIELAADRCGVALTPAQRAALDLYDELARRPELVLDMDFRPGDAQFLNNHVILHARSAYEDGPDPATRRELLRLWLVVPDLELPTAFADAGFVARTAVTAT